MPRLAREMSVDLLDHWCAFYEWETSTMKEAAAHPDAIRPTTPEQAEQALDALFGGL